MPNCLAVNIKPKFMPRSSQRVIPYSCYWPLTLVHDWWRTPFLTEGCTPTWSTLTFIIIYTMSTPCTNIINLDELWPPYTAAHVHHIWTCYALHFRLLTSNVLLETLTVSSVLTRALNSKLQLGFGLQWSFRPLQWDYLFLIYRPPFAGIARTLTPLLRQHDHWPHYFHVVRLASVASYNRSLKYRRYGVPERKRRPG